ncbi:MAG: hypothetical protein IPN42_05340 [Methylococcaceae bacterium]|nr:hypothetical protein [Methylococcaceae bacterium]
MNRIFSNGSLDPFLSFRVRMERAIRAQCSEHVVLQVHDAIYAPVKRATQQLGTAMQDRSGRQYDQAIAELRSLLDSDAKEREVQNALMQSGVLAVTSKVVQEVTIKASPDDRRMRMDLVIDAGDEFPSQVVELKRGSHLLLARRGQPSERLSRELTVAVEQLQGYGRRIESDPAVTLSIEQRHGIQLGSPELRLIAGRRLPDAQSYAMLSLVEAKPGESGLTVQIYTWYAFLAELERVLN